MKYELIKYPDGQISVKLDEFPVYFTIRIASYEDLFLLKSIVDVYKHNKKEIWSVTIPCLFGQRSDLRFAKNQSFDLKNICDFINSLEIPHIEIFDPHSPVCLGMINGSEKVDSYSYVWQCLKNIGSPCCLVSPDAGAYKKVFNYGERLKLPVIAANKFRDLEGKITLSILGDVKDKECFIIDDLLDGGYTFHLLGEKLKEQGAKKVHLYISHAYFNKGVDFTPHIDHFYCTDSVKEIIHEKVTQFKI